MSKNTPIPKTQKEISISQHEPYSKSNLGNPNKSQTKNRGEQISFKEDNSKPFSIGLEDLDWAIMYYFQNVIKPTVLQNGESIPVPVIYGSPEKWKSFQKDGYYRDSQGKMMLPIIMLKRDSIDKVRNIANKLDANNPNNLALFRKTYSSKNAYDNFNILNNIIPEKVNYAVVIPDYINLIYSCAINTYYMDQLNKIVEAIEYASDSYWGDPSRFQFRARIDSFTMKTELSDAQERAVSSTFNIKLNGYIVPDVLQKDITALKKLPDKVKIVFTTEMTSDITKK